MSTIRRAMTPLGFGDIILTGADDPTTSEVTWNEQLGVVGGYSPKDIHNEGSLSAFPVGAADNSQEAALWLPGTLSVEHVKILGKLTLPQARELFERSCAPCYRGTIMPILFPDGVDTQPALSYNTVVHPPDPEDRDVDAIVLLQRYVDRQSE